MRGHSNCSASASGIVPPTKVIKRSVTGNHQHLGIPVLAGIKEWVAEIERAVIFQGVRRSGIGLYTFRVTVLYPKALLAANSNDASVALVRTADQIQLLTAIHHQALDRSAQQVE